MAAAELCALGLALCWQPRLQLMSSATSLKRQQKCYTSMLMLRFRLVQIWCFYRLQAFLTPSGTPQKRRVLSLCLHACRTR